MSSTKTFKARMAQMSVARDGEQILAAMAYAANNQPLTSFGFTNGAAATVFKTGTSAALAVVGGLLVKVAASTNAGALTGLSVANGSKVHIALVLDSSGAITPYWGAISTAVAACTFPDIPLNTAVVGTVLLENGSGSGFTGGTTALDTAGITLTYANGTGPLAPVSVI